MCNIIPVLITALTSASFSADFESALKIATEEFISKDSPMVINEYLSEDGDWITESLIGKNRLLITTYRI